MNAPTSFLRVIPQLVFSVVIFAFIFLSLPTQFAHAGYATGCAGTTWSYTYTIETNPFPPGSGGYSAWSALYGGSRVVQSSYQVASPTLADEGCGADLGTPTASIIAIPSTITSGDSSEVSWSSTSATGCFGTNFSTGALFAGSVIVSPSASTLYSVDCSNDYASGSASATVTVNPPPAPTASLSASPTTINSGQSSVLTWSSTDATSCTGTNFSTGGATSGTATVSPSASTSYLISCTGGGGSASGSATVTVSAIDWVNMGCGPVSSTYNRSCNKTQEPVDTTCSEGYHLEGASIYDCPIGNNYNSSRDVRRCVVDASCIAPPPTPPPTLSASCSVSPTSVYTGSAVTWTAVPSGGTGSYTYSWSGTDSLSGSASTVTKTYSSAGTKTASVTVVSDTQTKTVTCSNSVAVSVPVSDLTPGALSPSSAASGVATTFTLGVTNGGTAATPVFGSTVYVCLSTDNACISGYLAHGGSWWSRLVRFLVPFAEANTSIKIALSRISLGAGATGSQTGTYTFASSGAYKVSACADTPLNEVAESNENDNCTAWTAFTVTPGVLNASCSASPSSGYVGDSVTWTAVPSGGTGSYTYSWSGTDSLSGSASTVTKTYSSAGTKTASVTVVSDTQTKTVNCSNSETVKPTPTVVITVTPNTVVAGSTSTQVTWLSTNATSCSSSAFNTSGATSGSVMATPLITTTYDITCTDGTRTASSSALITVNPVGLTLTVNPGTTVRQGDSATVTWSVVGTPDSCSITGPGLSSTALSGSQSIVINNESTYVLSCISGGVTSTKSVTITVTPHFQEF